jgi:hypothetical protein
MYNNTVKVEQTQMVKIFKMCSTKREEASEVLHLEHSFIWCRNLDASGSRLKTPGKF